MTNSTVLFAAGALLIAFVMLRRSHKRGRLTKLPPVSPPPHKAHPPAGHHLDAPGAMGRWEVEMHELARDLSGQLDSKIVIVQQLIDQARQATARLEAMIGRAEQVGLWQHGSGQPDEAASPTKPILPTGIPTCDRYPNQADTETIHPKPVRDWPNPAEPDVPQPDWTADSARAAAALIQRTQRVYRLADRGRSSAEIAAELGEPLGEVELILSVRTGEEGDVARWNDGRAGNWPRSAFNASLRVRFRTTPIGGISSDRKFP